MRRLHSSAKDFATHFARIVNDRRESDENVSRDVAEILAEVKRTGDEALRNYTMRFDHHALTADTSSWRITADQCKAAYDFLPAEAKDALNLAADRIRAHEPYQFAWSAGQGRIEIAAVTPRMAPAAGAPQSWPSTGARRRLARRRGRRPATTTMKRGRPTPLASSACRASPRASRRAPA